MMNTQAKLDEIMDKLINSSNSGYIQVSDAFNIVSQILTAQEGESLPTVAQLQRLFKLYQEGCEIQLYPDSAYEYLTQHEACLITFVLDNSLPTEGR